MWVVYRGVILQEQGRNEDHSRVRGLSCGILDHTEFITKQHYYKGIYPQMEEF